jgi:hypothetical protein
MTVLQYLGDISNLQYRNMFAIDIVSPFFLFLDFASKLIPSMQYGICCKVLWQRYGSVVVMSVSFDWQ